MELTDFFTSEGDRITFSRDQASRFAKEIANDFNPLHDPDANMFCVPGDLLFCVALNRFGLSEHMRFRFSGMVNDSALIFPSTDQGDIEILDDTGKQYLSIHRKGKTTQNASLIQNLSRCYVAFSGRTFPHILVPLMSQHGVMINPGRPLVMYQSMEISLHHLEAKNPTLEFMESALDIQGKKGMVRLDFCFKEQRKTIGYGAKYMALRGLQAYQEEAMQQIVANYREYKRSFHQ
jgi:hypothetical protein